MLTFLGSKLLDCLFEVVNICDKLDALLLVEVGVLDHFQLHLLFLLFHFVFLVLELLLVKLLEFILVRYVLKNLQSLPNLFKIKFIRVLADFFVRIFQYGVHFAPDQF